MGILVFEILGVLQSVGDVQGFGDSLGFGADGLAQQLLCRLPLQIFELHRELDEVPALFALGAIPEVLLVPVGFEEGWLVAVRAGELQVSPLVLSWDSQNFERLGRVDGVKSVAIVHSRASYF